MDPNATLVFLTECRHYSDGRPYLEVSLEMPQGTVYFTLDRAMYTDEDAALVEAALAAARPTFTPAISPGEWYKVQRATPNKRAPHGYEWVDLTDWIPRPGERRVDGGGYVRVVVRDSSGVWAGPMFYHAPGFWVVDSEEHWPQARAETFP